MTKVTVLYEGDQIARSTCAGHAGNAQAGENIVCAAVSILMQNCVNALEKVAGVQPATVADESQALISVEMPAAPPQSAHDAQIILRTTALGLSDIAREYPKMVKLHTLNGRNIL